MRRLDLELVARGLAESRTKAQRFIEEGAVTVDGTTVTKVAFPISDTADIHIDADSAVSRFVGRGGLKLEAALTAFEIDVNGKICLDIGASTGGFTDCLLKKGASLVYALDSGKDQLSPVLRKDSRVVSMEEHNAREMCATDFDPLPTVAVMDVSFVSQALIFPAIVSVLPVKGILISLIKPQFEVGRSGIGKNGIVKNEALRKRAVKNVCEIAATYGLRNIGLIPSPITGGDGNVEYLAFFVHEQEKS